LRLGQAPESYVWSKEQQQRQLVTARIASLRVSTVSGQQSYREYCTKRVFYSLKSKMEFRQKPVKSTFLLCGFLLLRICQYVHYYRECLFCRVPEHGSCHEIPWRMQAL
jgi:hypothetical protein